MAITSAGTFILDGTRIVVPDDNVSANAIIVVALQAAPHGGAGSWSGNQGVVDRVPCESFTFASARPGAGAKYGYLIFQP